MRNPENPAKTHLHFLNPANPALNPAINARDGLPIYSTELQTVLIGIFSTLG